MPEASYRQHLARIAIIALCAAITPMRARAQVATPPVFRGRLIGVFDEQSGQPIDSVEVKDMLTGTSALTTATGTLTLFFVDTAGSLIRLRKIGYQSLTRLITNSPQDQPLTLTLSRVGQVLPTVVTTATKHFTPRGPADTVRKLELNGFYDRRITTGAPGSSFITAEKLERLTLLSDVSAISSRRICETNLYIDGVRVTPIGSSRSGRFLRNGVDALLGVGEVAAIELYRDSDVPQQYNMTKVPGSNCGATLIWTK